MPRQAESCWFTPELRPGNEAARTSRLRHGGTRVVAEAPAAVPSVGRRSSYSRRCASSAPSRRLGYARAGRASAPVINERGWLTAFVGLGGRQRLLGRFSRRRQAVGCLEVDRLWQRLRPWRPALGLVRDRRRRVIEVDVGAGSVLRRQIGEGDGHVLVRSVGQVRGSTAAARAGLLALALISDLAKKIRCAN